MASCPLLILGNKIDKPNALGEDQLKWHLGVSNLTTGKVRSYQFLGFSKLRGYCSFEASLILCCFFL